MSSSVVHPRRRKAVAAGAVVAAAAVITAGFVGLAPIADAAQAPSTHAITNDPTGDAAAKNRIYTRLVELIDGAEAGSTIRAAWYYASATTVPDALVAAKQRGVDVQVVTDEEQSRYTTATDVLRTGLGTDTTRASYFTVCPANRACIADRGGWSIMHNKFYLFTRTLGASDVVFQTSTNLGGTGWRDGGTGWNDAMEVAGNSALFDSYTGYFGDLVARKTNNNYYDTRVPLQAGAAKVFYYPRAGSSTDGDPSEDTVMTILNHTECFGNSTVGTSGDHRTIIRVTTMEITLRYLADKLIALDAAGCYVKVNVRVDPDDADAKAALAAMLAKTSNAYGGVIVNYYCLSDPVWIHSKNFSIEGKYYDKPDRKIAWTGSLNWSGGSLRGDDEVMLQEENASIFDTYRHQYDAVAAAATHHPANGAAVVC